MLTMLGRGSAALALLAAVGALVGTAVAHPSAHAARQQRFTVYSANVNNRDKPLLVQATGPISGIGTATANDNAPGNAVPLTFNLPKGKCS